MKVVAGRFAELRVYLTYCAALFRPGVAVPVFEAPAMFTADLTGVSDPDLMLVIEEGRRQLDRQYADLERTRGRVGTALTVGFAALAAVAGLGPTALDGPRPSLILWLLSAVFIILGIAGAGAVLTAQARLGAVYTNLYAKSPSRDVLAQTYAEAAQVGEVTIAARVTVLRDATLLLVLGAWLLALAWFFRA
jgi:hypothetical protein